MNNEILKLPALLLTNKNTRQHEYLIKSLGGEWCAEFLGWVMPTKAAYLEVFAACVEVDECDLEDRFFSNINTYDDEEFLEELQDIYQDYSEGLF